MTELRRKLFFLLCEFYKYSCLVTGAENFQKTVNFWKSGGYEPVPHILTCTLLLSFEIFCVVLEKSFLVVCDDDGLFLCHWELNFLDGDRWFAIWSFKSKSSISKSKYRAQRRATLISENFLFPKAWNCMRKIFSEIWQVSANGWNEFSFGLERCLAFLNAHLRRKKYCLSV